MRRKARKNDPFSPKHRNKRARRKKNPARHAPVTRPVLDFARNNPTMEGMTNVVDKENTAQTRQAFARFVRAQGWKDPSPLCPREERETARHFLRLAWEAFEIGRLDNARGHVEVAKAIVREGEAWETRSAVA